MARMRARISVSSSYTDPRQPRWPGCRSDAITRHTSGYLAAREPLHATPTTDSSSSGGSVSACAMHEQQNEPRSGRPKQTRHRAERQHRGLGDVEPRVGQRPAQPPLVRFLAQPSAAEQQRRLHRQEDQDRRGHQQQPGAPRLQADRVIEPPDPQDPPGQQTGQHQKRGRAHPFPQRHPHAPPPGVAVHPDHHRQQPERRQQDHRGHRPRRQPLVGALPDPHPPLEEPTHLDRHHTARHQQRRGHQITELQHRDGQHRPKPRNRQHREHHGQRHRRGHPRPHHTRSGAETAPCGTGHKTTAPLIGPRFIHRHRYPATICYQQLPRQSPEPEGETGQHGEWPQARSPRRRRAMPHIRGAPWRSRTVL